MVSLSFFSSNAAQILSNCFLVQRLLKLLYCFYMTTWLIVTSNHSDIVYALKYIKVACMVRLFDDKTIVLANPTCASNLGGQDLFVLHPTQCGRRGHNVLYCVFGNINMIP